jgi:hypothetical protein
MTYAPPTITALMAVWTSHGGVNLGIVGDTGHVATGVSYHLGKDQLRAGAYSATLPRDKAGLSNAASACDLGKLGGSLAGLQTFSSWLVAQVRADQATYRDIREVIYSPDGTHVKRWDNELKALRDGGDGTGQGDNTHLFHTHISFYRDSEYRPKVGLFSRYFNPPPKAPEDPMGVSIKLGSTAGDPLASFGIATLKGAGHELISVATSAVVGKDMPDGYPLGLVEKGTLAKATGWGAAGEAVVTYNVDGAQAVSPLRDVTFTPMAPPPGVTPVAKVQTLDASGKVLNEFRPVTA